MEQTQRKVNPFDLITEDNEKGRRVPSGKKEKRVRLKTPRRSFTGLNGDEEIIHF